MCWLAFAEEGKGMEGDGAEEGAVDTMESLLLVKIESRWEAAVQRDEAELPGTIAAEAGEVGVESVEGVELLSTLPRRSSRRRSFWRMCSSGEAGAANEPSW